MKEISVNDLEEMRNLVERIPINKLIFWIGAGIDSGKPTCLPLGNELTDYILQLTCGTNSTRIIEMWKDVHDLFKMVLDEEVELAYRPRLETIIECVRQFEEHQIRKQSVIEGLRAFSSKDLPYNNEHFLLAQCLHKGANIVTTNYSDFVCRAYEDRYGEGLITHEHEDMHVYRLDNIWSNCIYHIHGISDDLVTIGANLSNVKNSLPLSFKEQFKHWMENNYIFVFMGYSGLDTLDVIPFFKSFEEAERTVGIYVRHSIDEKHEEASIKEINVLAPFERKYICPCISSEFFKILNGYNDMETIERKDCEYKWTDVFSKYATAYNPSDSEVFVSGLCYRLGLSMIKMFNDKDWISRITQSDNVDKWYKSYHAFQNATITGQSKIVKRQGNLLRNKKDKLMENDYQVARGKAYKVVKVPERSLYKMIKEKIEIGEKIDWSISTELNRYIQYFFEKNIFIYNRLRITSKRKKDNIVIAKKCLNAILKGGYDCIIDVNQINTAYRSYALCQSILGENIDDIIDKLNIALRNYADISSIDGVTMTLIYKAMVYLVDYDSNCNQESLKDAGCILKQLEKILYVCGLKKYYKRYCIAEKWYNKLTKS